MGITAIIIAKNEEKNIGRCIESLLPVADEIIVGNTGSEDKTSQIAQEKGAVVVQVEWEGYVKTKNGLNNRATHEYILSLDADEALSKELQASILALKDKLQGVYSFNRKTNYCGRWIRYSGWYPDSKPRLFPKSGARWAGADVHEELQFDKGLGLTQLHGNLLHYSYYSREEFRERMKYYAGLANPGYAEKQNPHRIRAGLRSLWAFIRTYFLKLGFLDGGAGWDIASQTLIYTYRKYL